MGSNGRMAAGLLFSGERGLVVSASLADGPANGRPDCGEVYVFRASQLTGFLDLANTATAATAIIYGPSDGASLRVLDVADATGDGIDDILLGAPSAMGTKGVAYIVSGGPTLTGTIDLATAPVVATFVGGTAGDSIGASGLLVQVEAVKQ